jgi:hypothetical protein
MLAPREKGGELEKAAYWAVVLAALGLAGFVLNLYFWKGKSSRQAGPSESSLNRGTPEPQVTPTQSGVNSVPAFHGNASEVSQSRYSHPAEVPPPPPTDN